MDWEDHVEGIQDTCLDVFGVGDDEVSYSPAAGGGPFTLNGIFDRETEIVQGDTITFRPTLELKLADLAVDPEQDDSVTIAGETYKVDWVRKDGVGGAVLIMTRTA